uniref:Uncharacterized protein n=1 Tax=Panagrolaimus sp. JU765 TaxID=591449 RepID=A0AC34QVU6_9BILA
MTRPIRRSLRKKKSREFYVDHDSVNAIKTAMSKRKKNYFKKKQAKKNQEAFHDQNFHEVSAEYEEPVDDELQTNDWVASDHEQNNEEKHYAEVGGPSDPNFEIVEDKDSDDQDSRFEDHGDCSGPEKKHDPEVGEESIVIKPKVQPKTVETRRSCTIS